MKRLELIAKVVKLVQEVGKPDSVQMVKLPVV